MNLIKDRFRPFLPYWPFYVVVLTPLIFAFMFLKSTSQETRCGYVLLVIAVYWMTEALPLSVTALIPIFAFPLFGILNSNDVCLVYMKDTVMMFLGGMMIAIAVEHCNLHRRIALCSILKFGQSPRRLMAGFMITAMFLSMWISNTATTAMMIPIVDAILQELYKIHTGALDGGKTDGKPEQNDCKDDAQLDFLVARDRRDSRTGLEYLDRRESQISVQFEPRDRSKSITTIAPNEECRELKNMYFLSIAYSANIGGTGCLTGTSPNLVLKELLDSSFSKPTGLNFATWMGFNVPGMLLCTFLGWVWLQFIHMGFGKNSRLPESTPEKEKAIEEIIRTRYNELGSMTFHERVVLTLFVLLVSFWFFREPGFIPGWASLFQSFFGDHLKIKDSCPAMVVAVALFAIPALPKFGAFRKILGLDESVTSPGCLTWDIVHEKIPWGIVLLVGGGFAMAKAATVSGLSFWLGEQMRVISALPSYSSVIIFTLATAMITEVASNTATASVLMPILQDVSLGICTNPLYFMLPTTICCSYAFMLPAATPPNAIIYGTTEIKTSEMIKSGFGMNILCILVINFMINTLGVAVFDVHHLPLWVNSTTGDYIPECNYTISM